MKLVIPEELFNIKEYVTKVEILKDLTYDIKEVRLALAPGEEVSFQSRTVHAVLYQTLRQSHGGGFPSLFHFFSAPGHDPSGVLSSGRYLRAFVRPMSQTALKQGDEVSCQVPTETSIYRGNCDTMVMVAAGSGLAPMRSLIYDNLSQESCR